MIATLPLFKVIKEKKTFFFVIYNLYLSFKQTCFLSKKKKKSASKLHLRISLLEAIIAVIKFYNLIIISMKLREAKYKMMLL
jgi:hypothetical protein